MNNRYKRIRTVLSVFLCIVISTNALAQHEIAQSASTLENSLLWEISGNGLSEPSYLFGTIHMIPKKDYFFSKIMQEKFNSCKTLALEIDMDIPLSKQVEIAREMILPNGVSIQNYMSDEAYFSFKHYVLDTLLIKEKKFKQVQRLKPFYGSAILISELLGKTVAYEQKLSQAAKKNKMSFAALETIEYQLSIVDKMSIEKQVQLSYIDGFKTNPMEEFAKLNEAYKTQNLEVIREMILAESDFANFEKDFLITRNNNWIPVIKELTQKQSTFIAVGAAHLVGENGLIVLLRKEGFNVKAVK